MIRLPECKEREWRFLQGNKVVASNSIYGHVKATVQLPTSVPDRQRESQEVVQMVSMAFQPCSKSELRFHFTRICDPYARRSAACLSALHGGIPRNIECKYDRDGLSGVSEAIVYDDMNNRPFSSTTLTAGQELLSVGKAIELSKISTDVGRTVFGTSRTKLAS